MIVNIDGKQYFVKYTDELFSDMRMIYGNNCLSQGHTSGGIVSRQSSSGVTIYQNICTKCKNVYGSQIKKSTITCDTLPWDEEAYNRALTNRKKEEELIYRKHALLQDRQKQNEKYQYSEYLRSEEWAQKREKVLARAKYTCEGCLEERATEVHHTTYEHKYEEFCFELLALCRKCHSRVHGRDELEDEF